LDANATNKYVILRSAEFILGTYSIRYPDDFVPRKRNSIDLKILEDLMSRDLVSKTSPHDFRKISSPNFRKTSLDKIGGERRFEKSLGSRKASFEFKRSPDLRKSDYRYCVLRVKF
jgi:hypothetical protein